MHPYRDPPDPPAIEPPRVDDDEVRTISWTMLALGGSRGVVALVTGEQLGFEVTVAGALVVLGSWLAIRARSRIQLPHKLRGSRSDRRYVRDRACLHSARRLIDP